MLARHLLETGQSGTIVQVFRDDALGRLPAQVLRTELQGKGGGAVMDHPLSESGRLPVDIQSRLAGQERPVTLVLWLDSSDLAALELAAVPPHRIEAVYISASLARMRPPSLSENWQSRLYMIYPFDLPASREQRLTRMKGLAARPKHSPG